MINCWRIKTSQVPSQPNPQEGCAP